MNPKTTEQKILKFIDREELIIPGDKILLALSGGPDSVFALNFLKKYQRRLRIEFAAVHVNHQLRGVESDRDERFAQKICAESGISCFTESADVKSRKKKRRESLEEAARNLRYQILEKVAFNEGFSKILTAHNQSDNAETVLLNFVKGTGAAGLRGIPQNRGKIIRPFICVSKSDILEYLKANKIRFRRDRSNDDLNFQRNYLRKKIIPELERNINPSLTESIFTTSRNFRTTEKVLDDFIRHVKDKYSSSAEGQSTLKLSLLKDFSLETLLETARRIGSEDFGIVLSRKDSDRIADLTNSITGTKISLRKNIAVIRERGKISFLSVSGKSGFLSVKIRIGETFEEGGNYLRIEQLNEHSSPKFGKKYELIAGDKLSDEFVLRNWKPGDKFRPLGMKKFKKVSDFLTDEKISTVEKQRQIVLENKGEIVYIPGLRIGDKFKLKSNTKKIIKLWTKK